MNRPGPVLVAITVAATTWCGCARDRSHPPQSGAPGAAPGQNDLKAPAPAAPPRPSLSALVQGEAYLYDDKSSGAKKISPPFAGAAGDAKAKRALVVDLSDSWAPFIFQDSGGVDGVQANDRADDSARPNAYRQTFVDLANDRIAADGRPLDKAAGERNFLEPFGIPPTLSVLRARVEDDLTPARQVCHAKVDLDGLRAFVGSIAVSYLDRERARREHAEASRDSDWLNGEIARRAAAPGVSGPGGTAAALAALRADKNPSTTTRIERALRGQQRIRAVQALQARLTCEGLLSARSRFIAGMFDLPTHEALAEWERKNDIFGWASLGGEALATLLRPPLDLHFETLRRILAERVADAAGIVEDGSTSKGQKWQEPPTYLHSPAGGGAADGGARIPVPNLINDHVQALLASIHVASSAEMVGFLRQHPAEGWATLRVAFVPPPLPPYYGPQMELSVEIDRGDVWYDFPFDPKGRPVEQPREHFPHLTLFVHWAGQKIPLCSWRTTVGSWRSERHANGKIYYKYKNSDVGPRLWKNIVAGPVWIPPEATPAKDLLRRKVLNTNKGAEVVVNTEVMGPGFQSAYGLVMAIHIERSGFDNQIRTHGSVDYTSIARRFSHGCHRLVNNRAVRMFDFVLRRQPFRRIGSVPLSIKRNLVVDGTTYPFELKTRGYYYELLRPIAVTVGEGVIKGKVKSPIVAYMRKAGVDYGGVGAISRDVPNDVPNTVPDEVSSAGDITAVAEVPEGGYRRDRPGQSQVAEVAPAQPATTAEETVVPRSEAAGPISDERASAADTAP